MFRNRNCSSSQVATLRGFKMARITPLRPVDVVTLENVFSGSAPGNRFCLRTSGGARIASRKHPSLIQSSLHRNRLFLLRTLPFRSSPPNSPVSLRCFLKLLLRLRTETVSHLTRSGGATSCSPRRFGFFGAASGSKNTFLSLPPLRAACAACPAFNRNNPSLIRCP